MESDPTLCAPRLQRRKYLEVVVGGSPPDRPAYLLGESFGGVLALAVAQARPDLVDRVVLVNPATSFPRSVWPALGPLLPSVPKVRGLCLITSSFPRPMSTAVLGLLPSPTALTRVHRVRDMPG